MIDYVLLTLTLAWWFAAWAICWKVGRYLETMIFNKVYKNHRIAIFYMTGEWPDEVDHINGDRGDNRYTNLRNVSKQDNMRNRGRNRNNTSGTSGITWFNDTQQWRVRINANGKRISPGPGS